MAFFSAAAAALLEGRVLRRATLVHFDFTTTPRNLWLGFGRLYAGGEFWDGLGELGGISGLDSALGGSAPQVTFTLSGVSSDLVSIAMASVAEVKGRGVVVKLQVFDDQLYPLDSPYALYRGVMDTMRIKAAGSAARTIEVTAETVFARRAFPPFQYLSDRDQQSRYPGDRGLEFVPQMIAKTAEWPPQFQTK